MRKLTAKEFAKRSPDAEINEGLLENMACPECGQRRMFHINYSGVAEVSDDTSEDAGDHEWDEVSNCRCSQCDAHGSVRDFTIPGLDELLYRRTKIIERKKGTNQ